MGIKNHVYVEIGEPTHDESNSDDTTRGDANGKGERRAYLDFC